MVDRGVDVSAVFHLDRGRVTGPDPQGRSYQSYASFTDPDGNGWTAPRDHYTASGREWEDCPMTDVNQVRWCLSLRRGNKAVRVTDRWQPP
jgi:hypothetical protein